jgi:non-ribosomal peptide synthetase component F
MGNPDIVLPPDAFAFIFYTSGSTGKPKGVVWDHRNALHAIMNDTNLFHVCADDRLTFVAWRGLEIFGALLNGAAVYPVNITQDGLDLANWLTEEITMYGSVVSVFRHFVNTLTERTSFQLRLIN